ncbi:MAG: ADP-ribosylglycohydrolase family protein [Christensenellales bacterium]
MIGAIIGDIVGSRFEFNNIRTKDFKLFSDKCTFTDDTVLTLAIARAIMESKDNFEDLSMNTIKYMKLYGKQYTNMGYGAHFYSWLYSDSTEPYNSCGNGSAMRVSAVGWIAKSMEECKNLSKKVTEVTHNHRDGILGAECTACCIYLARNGASKEEIKKFVQTNYYDLNFTIEELQKTKNYFDVVCQQTVPQAIQCFLESKSFEDCIRNTICITGDSDTLGAIAGSIAEAYYGVSNEMKETALSYLTNHLKKDYTDFMQFLQTKQNSNNLSQLKQI